MHMEDKLLKGGKTQDSLKCMFVGILKYTQAWEGIPADWEQRDI